MENSDIIEHIKREVKENLYMSEINTLIKAGLSDEQLQSRPDPDAPLTEEQTALLELIYSNHILTYDDNLQSMHVFTVGSERYVVKDKSDAEGMVDTYYKVVESIADKIEQCVSRLEEIDPSGFTEAEGINEQLQTMEHQLEFLQDNPVVYRGPVDPLDVYKISIELDNFGVAVLPLIIMPEIEGGFSAPEGETVH